MDNVKIASRLVKLARSVISEVEHPFPVQGKNFRMTVGTYAFGAEGSLKDGEKTRFVHNNAASARKLYDLLKVDKNLLQSVPFHELGKWLDKNHIEHVALAIA